jgi:Cu-Zn family superoxide dismutase
MRITTPILTAAAVLAAASITVLGRQGEQPQTPPAGAAASGAAAKIEAKSGSTASGEASFSSAGGKVTMNVKVTGLAPGTHAIHLHEKGDCSDPEAKLAGPHWNPSNEAHGRWGQGAFHHGDIGNLEANAKGEASLTFATDMWTIGGPASSDIIGRAVVVHEKADDFQTQPTGNAGGRIGCGVIQKK